MRVAEFIEWLKTQDQMATVEVVVHTNGTGYYDQGGNATTHPFDPDKHVERTDMRGNALIPPTSGIYGMNTILLGVYNG